MSWCCGVLILLARDLDHPPLWNLALAPRLAHRLRRNAEERGELRVAVQARPGKQAVQNGVGIGIGWRRVHAFVYTRTPALLSIFGCSILKNSFSVTFINF